MHILLINPEYPPIGGGAGNASENIARCLVSLGQEVTVLTCQYRGLPRRETRGGVQIVRAPAIRRRLDRSKAYEQISFVFGGGVRAIPLLVRRKPDAVLAFFGMPSGGIALPLKWLFRIPYVVSLRGGDVPGFRPYDFGAYHRLFSPLLRLVWRQAGAVAANSRGLRSLAQPFDRRVPIQIIPNGVDTGIFAPPPREWDPPRLLFVGRVVYQKGLDLLIHALGALRRLPWELTIVGDGPQRGMLEKLAENLEIGGRVRFPGWLRGAELVAEYHRANLFTYVSRHEGMPNALLEAMASGLPAIASDIAGNEELVLPGETGLLVASESQPELEHALADLLPAAARRARMGEAARQRVMQDYPWERVAEQYLHLLEKVAGIS
jgi:glycosyltransferase involved in cell wall biosynthesis